jgi:uncharacterized membrane protein (UPF0127 family)
MRRVTSTFSHRAATFAALFVFAACVLAFAGAASLRAEMRKDTLKLVTASGTHTFQIEVAETASEKARGLMFRRSLAEDAGMLFPYEPPQEATMWMRNTYIPLDMVFIRQDGIVHRVETNTEPFSEAVIASNGNVSAVLELKAGIARRIGLKAGDKALNKLFGTAP